jgi:6-phosphogluconolactonase
MIEAEWWDYEDADELYDAVASDIEFIIDSALDARGDALIAFLPIGARVIPLIGDAKAEYKKAGLDADERLGAMKWPLDLAWLVVDAEGGSGSLVASPDLDAAISAPATCRAIGVMPASGKDGRVTLTRTTLMAARALSVACQGKAAKAALEAALEDGARSKLPIGRLLAGTELAFDIHWVA